MHENKKWQTPELIILTRGRPEENILSSCRFEAAGDGFGDIQSGSGRGCQAKDAGSCRACRDLGGRAS